MQPQQPYGPAPAPLQPSDYGFITNPDQPKRRRLGLGNSMPQRLVVVLGGLLILVIIIIFVVKLFSHTTNAKPALTAVAQQQQELLHLTNGNEGSSGSGAPALSTDNKNAQATIQLVVTSSQNQLLSYMSTNHYKVKGKVITGYFNSALDQQLTAATTDGTFDATFASIVQSQLNSYETSLKQAYLQVAGPKGRALLSSDYNQALLLQQQLTSPAS